MSKLTRMMPEKKFNVTEARRSGNIKIVISGSTLRLAVFDHMKTAGEDPDVVGLLHNGAWID
jgi:hypothetical protein